MPIRVPVVQTGLEASIQAAAKKAGKAMKIDMGAGAKSIEGLSQPLGRITGKADQFTKSMEAANARVLAFGASVGVLSAVSRGFQELVKTTIEVEKRLTSINSILGGTTAQLHKFKKEIFDVARNTEQSFDTVSQAALELSRQGLKAEEVTSRLNDSLILARLSGLGASEAVFGLTAAINSFRKEGISSAEVLNKLSAAAVSAAVSEKDLIEGIKRSGSVATQAGVSFNELVGVITAVQERTARGGAVIGNSFKTIFTRIQSLEKLKTMQDLGVQVEDASGQVLGATKLIQNLAKTLEKLPDATRLQIAENLVGKFQIAPFLAILEDYNSATSTAIRVTEVAAGATSEAYQRNIAISKTLSHAINETVLSVKELADTLGKIGVTDSLRGILDFFNTLTANVNKVLEGDTLGSKFAKGIVKGIGGVLSGPGLAIFGAIIAKLTLDLAKFGLGSLKTFFGLNKAARDQVTLQGQIASTLLGNKGIQAQIMAIENSTLSIEQKRAAQTRFFTVALNEQLAVMTRMQAIAARVAPGVMAGTRGRGRGAGGYIPNFNATMGYGSEQADINRGVGGAPKGARPVTVPNFNFGGGQRGTMVANSSEYVVPNFGGGAGSAIFNQNMVSSMGLPAGARKIGAAGGYIPNFAPKKGGQSVSVNYAGMIVPDKGKTKTLAKGTFGGVTYQFPVYGINAAGEKVREEQDIKNSVEKYAIGLATREAKTMTGGRPKAGKIGKLSNQGSIGSLAGSIFETALSALLRSKEFDFGETSTFDFVGPQAVRDIGDISPSLKNSPVRFLEAKIGSNAKTNISMAKKIQKFFGKGATGRSMTEKGRMELLRAGGGKPIFHGSMGMSAPNKSGGTMTRGFEAIQHRLGMSFRQKGASGYIPNYATPLEDAINREQAAGLPISQIRINQDSGLRGAGNPMGLAVTNMRDEPTGAIPRGAGGFMPNYVNTGGMRFDVSKLQRGTSPTPPGGQRDLLGPIFAVTAAMSALQGATSGATGTIGKVTNELAKMVAGLTTVVFASTALKGFTNDLKETKPRLGGFLGGLTTAAAVVAGTIALYKGLDKVLMETSGLNDVNNTSLSRLADAANNASRKLESLGNLERQQLDLRAKDDLNKLLSPYNLGGGVRQKSGTATAAQGVIVETTKLGQDDKAFIKNIQDTFTQTNLAGVDPQTIRDILKEAARGEEGGTRGGIQDVLTQREFDAVIPKILKEIAVAEKGVSEDEKQFRTLLNVQDIGSLKDLLKGFETGTKEAKLGLDILRGTLLTPDLKEKAASSPLGRGAVATLPFAGTDLRENEKILIIKETIKRLETEIAATADEGVRLRLETQKKVLTSALELSRLRITDTSEIQKQIKNAQIFGNLTKEEARVLERRLFVEEQANKRITNRIDLIKKEVKETGGLSISLKERDALARKFAGLKREEIEKADQLRVILEGIIGVDKTRKINAEGLIDNLFEMLTAGEDVADEVDRMNLGLKDSEISSHNIADNLGRAADILNAQAKSGVFQAGLENRRATLGDQGTLRGINRDLIGASPQDRARLEAQRGGLQAGIAGRGVVEQERFRLSREFALKLAAKEGTAFMDDAIRQVKEATTTEQLSQIIEQKKKGTKAQQDLFEESAGIDFKDALEEQAFVLDQLGDAATAAGEELGTFATAMRESALTLSQAEIMGVGVAEARRLDEATRGSLGKNLTPQNARTLSTLQRSVGQRLEEHPDFNELYQADTLASTITTAALNFKNTMSDAMVDSIVQGGNLGDILRGAATDFFTMISKAYMQDSVNKIVGSGGGFLSSLLGGLGRAGGGLITGGSGNRDDVPTLLTGGEFVIRKSAVEKYGAGFFEGLNTGGVGQMARGGLYSPGTYGQGAISGKRNLLDFATQSFTGGQFDRIGGGAGFGSASLEPQSAALTMFGRRNSPLFQREQQSKQQAFGLYTQQIQYEQQLKEQEKQQRKQLFGSIIAAVGAAAFSGIVSGLVPQDPRNPNLPQRDPAAGGVGRSPSRGRAVGGGGAAEVLSGSNRVPPVPRPFVDRFESDMVDLDIPDSALREILHRHPTDGSPFRNNRSAHNRGGGGGWAAGGYISPTAGVDTVPSMLSGGEFVMNAAATQRMGRGNLAALNSGGGGGGDDGAVVARLDELIAVTDGSGETVINITVNSDGTESQDTQGGQEDQQNLATKIKDVVRATIDEEKRLGGSLRRI